MKSVVCDIRHNPKEIVLKMAPRRFLDNDEFSVTTLPIYSGSEERRKSQTNKRNFEKFKLQVSSNDNRFFLFKI